MKNLTFCLLICLPSFIFSQVWEPINDFTGGTCSNAGAVSYDGKIYSLCMYTSEFHAYIPDIGSWSPLAAFPGGGRTGGVMILIDNFIYYGTGDLTAADMTDDWWKYDPAADEWTQLENFPGYLFN